MVQYKLKTLATTALSSALIVSTLSGFTTSVEAATKVQKVKDVKFKKGKLVKKSNGQVIKGYVSYKGVIYKDGNTFTGILNKYYFKKGKKATGLYKSKYYKNGSLGTGIYKKHYYKAGILGSGTYQGKKYVKGKLLTGLSGNTYYKNGVLGTGSYKGKKYVKGKLFSGLSNNLYYKDGILGTGLHEDHYYVKGKFGSGEFEGILYEAGKVFTGEKDGIFYQDGKKDENQTNVANFKKAETAVQQAHNSFKKAQEQKAALEQLAKQVNLSPNTQTEGSGDIDAFLTKYKDVDVSKLTGSELTTFKDELNEHIVLANQHLQTTRTDVTNAVITFIAATNTIASTTDNALLTHIKKAVAAATSIVASLKTAGYDTLQLENALSKLPGGTPTGNGGSNSGGGSSTPGGGGSNEGESDEVIAQKLDALSKAQKAVEEKQIAYDELFALQKDNIEYVDRLVEEYNLSNMPQNKKVHTLKSNLVTSIEEFKETYPDIGYIFNGKVFENDVEAIYKILRGYLKPASDELIAANEALLQVIQSISSSQLNEQQKDTFFSAVLLSEASVQSLSVANQNIGSLQDRLNKLPDTSKPTSTQKEQIIHKAVQNLFEKNHPNTVIAENVTQSQINSVQKLVKVLPDSEIKTTLLNTVKNAQDLFDKKMAPINATNAVHALFNEGGTELAAHVNQKNIDHARSLIEKLPDDSDEETTKKDLLDQLNQAQILLAIKLTSQLLNGEKLAANTTIEHISAAETAVGKIKNNTTLIDELTSKVNHARYLYNIAITPSVVYGLLEGEKLAANIDQAAINDAQNLVNLFPTEVEGITKDALQKVIDQAQGLFITQLTQQIDALVVDGQIAPHATKDDIFKFAYSISLFPDELGDVQNDLITKLYHAFELFVEKKVNALFNGDNLADGVNEARLDEVIELLQNLEDSPKTNELIEKFLKAQDLFVANKVNNLFVTDSNDTELALGVDEEHIMKVEELLVKVKDEDLKVSLQDRIDHAYSLLSV